MPQKIKQSEKHMEIKNKNFSFKIDLNSGMLSCFSMFGSPQAQWDDICENKLIYKNKAGVVLKDGLAEKTYSDPLGCGRVLFYHDPRKLVNCGRGTRPLCGKAEITKGKERIEVVFDKTYKGAPFKLKYQFLIYNDHVRWDILLSLNPGHAERSVGLEYSLPLFREINGGYFPKGWKVWVPLEDAPFDFGNIGGWGHSQSSWYVHHFPYCSVNAGAGIGIPLMDVYSDAYDLGLALMAPPDLLKPEIVFITDKEKSRLKLTYENMGLRKGNEWRTSLMLYPHKGDWRNALGWFHEKHRKYFLPNNPKIVEQEGTMFYGVPTVPEKTIKAWVENMGLKWTEVLYNPVFGDYVPEKDTWDFDMLVSRNNPGKIIKNLTKDKLRQYLKMLKRHKVASFAYFNFGECDRRLATEKFPEDIVWGDHGKIGAWVFPDGKRDDLTMYPDPDCKWGEHMVQEAEKILDAYADLDGFFIDQLCYHSYDYSKDDGMTMINNRPVADTHWPAMRMMERIAALLKQRGKTSFANGPYNLEIMQYADGIMSEGSLAGLAKYSFMCLEKPVMVLTYNVFGRDFEKALKACLKYGAFPSTPWHHENSFAPDPPAKPPRETMMLYHKYLPLLETLRGRKWVLSSRPVSFSTGLDGNIFKAGNGGFVLPFFTREALFSNRLWNKNNCQTITVRLPGMKKLKNVEWLSVNFKGKRNLPVKHARGEFFIDVPKYTDASVLRF